MMYFPYKLCQDALTSSVDSGLYFTDATGNTTGTTFVDELRPTLIYASTR